FISHSFPSHSLTTTPTNTLSLHDALPISLTTNVTLPGVCPGVCRIHISSSPARIDASSTSDPSISTFSGSGTPSIAACTGKRSRSEEHTSELQSRGHLVCRLLLEKKNTIQ